MVNVCGLHNYMYTVRVKKGKPRFNFKSQKNENKDHKTNNREWWYNYFSFIWYIGHAYWITDDCSAIIFVKRQNYFFSTFWVLAWLSCVKGNPSLTQNFSKLKKDLTKLISVHDSIFIFLLYGTLIVHIGSGMAAQQSFL